MIFYLDEYFKLMLWHPQAVSDLEPDFFPAWKSQDKECAFDIYVGF